MTIQELQSARDAAVAKARASGLYEDHQAAKQCDKDLSAAIAAEAKSCPACGTRPHGMVQPMLAGKFKFNGFEIGCLACNGKRSKGVTLQDCTANWNEDSYL